jgi:hypothetical protein
VGAGFRYTTPSVSSAQIILAVLSANAKHRHQPAKPAGQLQVRLPRLMTDLAPTIRSVLSCSLARFEMEPSRSLPPLEWARGVRPIQVWPVRLFEAEKTALDSPP